MGQLLWGIVLKVGTVPEGMQTKLASDKQRKADKRTNQVSYVVQEMNCKSLDSSPSAVSLFDTDFNID